jgi:anti-sigma B factor antagonist
MRIEERTLGDVFVLDLHGKVTLGEGSTQLRDRIDAILAAGTKNIVLNFEDVPYIDSSGVGEIVRSFTVAHRRGGRLRLCHLTKRLSDLLTITKLHTVFEVYENLEDLVADTSVLRLQATCPQCGPERWIRADLADEYQRCPACGLLFKISTSDPDSRDDRTGTLTAFRLPTYDREYIHVTLDEPSRVVVVGRLDLFTADTAEHAVRMIRPPRRVLYSLESASDISPVGLAQLFRLCRQDAGEDRGVASAEGLSQERQKALPQHPALHSTDREARVALGAPVGQTGRPTVVLRPLD